MLCSLTQCVMPFRVHLSRGCAASGTPPQPTHRWWHPTTVTPPQPTHRWWHPTTVTPPQPAHSWWHPTTVSPPQRIAADTPPLSHRPSAPWLTPHHCHTAPAHCGWHSTTVTFSHLSAYTHCNIVEPGGSRQVIVQNLHINARLSCVVATVLTLMY